MGKNKVKLNEAQLRKVIKESVKKVLNEWNYDPIYGDYDFNTESEPTKGEQFEWEYDIDYSECVDSEDVKFIAEKVMDAIEHGKFTNSKRTPIEIYNELCGEAMESIQRHYRQEQKMFATCSQWIKDMCGQKGVPC